MQKAQPLTKVVPINRKQEELQRKLLEDMEDTLEEFQRQQSRIDKMNNIVMDKIERAIKSDTITPYKACTALGRISDNMTRGITAKFGLYDRLQGTVGQWGGSTEEDEISDVDFEVERTAERLCFEIVKSEVERKRADAAKNIAAKSEQTG